MEYLAKDIEKKWQKFWIDNKSFEPSDDFSKPKNIYIKYVSVP